jgi:ubiquitin-protein ligase
MNLSIHKELQCLLSRIQQIGNGQILSLKSSTERIKCVIKPDQGFWATRELVFEIKTKNYPRSPCKVLCKSKILHPNILEIDGEVCLSLFDEDWEPSMRLEHYLIGILYILHHPNFEDPLSDYFCIAKEQGKISQAIQSLS